MINYICILTDKNGTQAHGIGASKRAAHKEATALTNHVRVSKKAFHAVDLADGEHIELWMSGQNIQWTVVNDTTELDPVLEAELTRLPEPTPEPEATAIPEPAVEPTPEPTGDTTPKKPKKPKPKKPKAAPQPKAKPAATEPTEKPLRLYRINYFLHPDESKYKAALVIMHSDLPEDESTVKTLDVYARSDEAAKAIIQEQIGPGDDRLILRRKETRQLVVANGQP